jgi:serine/threonine protein kinase
MVMMLGALTDPVGSAVMMIQAPEVAFEKAVDPFAADTWCLGVMLYILLTGSPLYSSPQDPAFHMLARGEAAALFRHYEGFGLHISPEAADLIAGMLHPDINARLTLDQVRHHPWTVANAPASAAPAF